MTIDEAIAAGARGMQQAQAGAGEWFSEQAFRFVQWYSATAAGPFPAEAVVEMARLHGLVTLEERAWGPVFMRAARASIIRRSSVTYRRAKGHGSLGVMWEAVRA